MVQPHIEQKRCHQHWLKNSSHYSALASQQTPSSIKSETKNTIKLSYSCMSNIKQSIANHNKAILSKQKIEEEKIKLCNCRNRTLYPLQDNCLQKGVVYQTTITLTNTMREEIYIGITENEFKTRYNQHTSSFRLSHKSSATSLSEHIRKLKENNTDHT